MLKNGPTLAVDTAENERSNVRQLDGRVRCNIAKFRHRKVGKCVGTLRLKPAVRLISYLCAAARKGITYRKKE